MTDEQINAAARALADHNADICNVNREDNWMIYGEDFRESAKIALAAASAVAPSASIADTAGAKPWQPIANAPKDIEIWAYNGEQARMLWSEGPDWALWIWADQLLSDADPSPDQPTHWMPLPASPDTAIAAPPAPSVADAAGARPVVIDDMVSRFLGWKLPQDFYPDCFVTFDREKASAQGSWPVGTNLLHAGQARAMLEHVLAAPSVADAACVDCQENCQTCGIYKKSGSNRAMSFEEFCDLHIDAQDTIDRAWLRNFTRLWDVFRQGDPSSVADAAIDCGECACFPGICDKEEALKVADAANAYTKGYEDGKSFVQKARLSVQSSVADAAGAREPFAEYRRGAMEAFNRANMINLNRQGRTAEETCAYLVRSLAELADGSAKESGND